MVFRTPDSAGRALSAWCLSCGQNPLPSGYFCYHLPLRAALPEPCRRQRPEARRLRLPGGSRGRWVACQEPCLGGEGVGEERFRKVMQYSVAHPSPSPIIAKYLKFKGKSSSADTGGRHAYSVRWHPFVGQRGRGWKGVHTSERLKLNRSILPGPLWDFLPGKVPRFLILGPKVDFI